MHLSKEELAFCKKHHEILQALLVEIRIDINSASKRNGELNKEMKRYKSSIPYLGKLIAELFLDGRKKALEEKITRLNSLREKLADDYFVYYQMVEKIKFGGNSVTPEYVVEFFTWLTQRLINNSSIPSTVPTELWEISIQIMKREQIPTNALIEKISNVISSLPNRLGYQRSQRGAQKNE